MQWIRKQAWPVLRRSLSEWGADDGNRLAASLAYYGVLSLFPMLMVLVSAFGRALAIWPQLNVDVLGLIGKTFTADVAEQVATVLGEIKSHSSSGGPIGIIVLLISAIGIFAALDEALRKIWKVKDTENTRGIWRTILDILLHRLRAFVMLLGIGLLLLLTWFSGFALKVVREFASDWPIPPVIWSLANFFAAVVLNALFFAMIYKLLSKGPVTWLTAFLGGMLTAVAWELGRLVLASFIISKDYNAYGVIGALLAIMLWFYYASTVLLFGAEVIQVVTRRRMEEKVLAGIQPRSD